MFHMQSGEVKIAEHTKIEISINKHGKSSKESETLFWNVALKVSTINWKLTCKTIHSDTQVIQTVPIGKYTFKHKTVKYRRSSMVLKAIRQKVDQEKWKTKHFLPLKRRREEVVLKPNKLILSTILFQTPSVKVHISGVDLLRTLELSDKLPGQANQWRSLASRHILELKDKTGWKPLEVCIESYLK